MKLGGRPRATDIGGVMFGDGVEELIVQVARYGEIERLIAIADRQLVGESRLPGHVSSDVFWFDPRRTGQISAGRLCRQIEISPWSMCLRHTQRPWRILVAVSRTTAAKSATSGDRGRCSG